MKMTAFFMLCILTAWSCTGCDEQKSANKLKVAATSVPHAELLEQIKPDLAAKGISLEVIVIDDYQIPNRALADGEVDANFFQHGPFLEAQIEQFGYPITRFANIHLEPMALYSVGLDSLSQLAKGATVAIPSDPANQARALLLLEKQGLIHLQRQDVHATLLSVISNPMGLNFLEIDAPLLARALADVELAAINTNFALQAGLLPQEDALAIESTDSLFANILAIRQGQEESSSLIALKEVLQSEKTREFIQTNYQNAIIPVK